MLCLASQNRRVIDAACMSQQLIQPVVVHFSLHTGRSQDENLLKSVNRSLEISFLVKDVEVNLLLVLKLHLSSGPLQFLLLQKAVCNFLKQNSSSSQLSSLCELESDCFAHCSRGIQEQHTDALAALYYETVVVMFNNQLYLGSEYVREAPIEVDPVENYELVVFPHSNRCVCRENEELVAVWKAPQLQQIHLFKLNVLHSHRIFAQQLKSHHFGLLLSLHHSHQNLCLLLVKQEFKVFTLRVTAHLKTAQQLTVLHLSLFHRTSRCSQTKSAFTLHSQGYEIVGGRRRNGSNGSRSVDVENLQFLTAQHNQEAVVWTKLHSKQFSILSLQIQHIPTVLACCSHLQLQVCLGVGSKTIKIEQSCIGEQIGLRSKHQKRRALLRNGKVLDALQSLSVPHPNCPLVVKRHQFSTQCEYTVSYQPQVPLQLSCERLREGERRQPQEYFRREHPRAELCHSCAVVSCHSFHSLPFSLPSLLPHVQLNHQSACRHLPQFQQSIEGGGAEGEWPAHLPDCSQRLFMRFEDQSVLQLPPFRRGKNMKARTDCFHHPQSMQRQIPYIYFISRRPYHSQDLLHFAILHEHQVPIGEQNSKQTFLFSIIESKNSGAVDVGQGKGSFRVCFPVQAEEVERVVVGKQGQ